jgi:hypothetical protein
MAEQSENQNLRYFDAKFCFALLASLRSAIYREIQVANLLVTFPERSNENQLVIKI